MATEMLPLPALPFFNSLKGWLIRKKINQKIDSKHINRLSLVINSITLILMENM